MIYSIVKTTSGTFLIFTADSQPKPANSTVTTITGQTASKKPGLEEKLLIPASFIMLPASGSVKTAANAMPPKPASRETIAKRREKVSRSPAAEKPMAL